VSGPDDFASMEEVLIRRFNRWQAAQEDLNPAASRTRHFALLPDLLLIDGGKGQLSRAASVSWSVFSLTVRVPVASLAKQQEEIFMPGRARSILLPRHSQGLYLVQSGTG
jgi:excinuclease ABC subunit C